VIAAAKREAADDRHAADPEHGGLREGCSLAIAIEKTAHAHAFGMIAAEPGVYSEDLFKPLTNRIGVSSCGLNQPPK